MTNETTQNAHPSRLQDDLIQAVANLRCIHELMLNAEGISALPVHARISIEGVIRGLEGYTTGEMRA